MNHLKITLFIVLIASTCFGQPISKGDKLRHEGKITEAIEAYKSVYQSSPEKRRNTYNLACAFALTYQVDSAYQYLKIALKDDNTLWALADSDLFSLIDDPRWATIETNQMARFQKGDNPIKQPEYAIKLLNSILIDQSLDYHIDQAKSAFMKNGFVPQWYYPLGAFKQRISKDKNSNMMKLLDTNGWPKYSEVGKLAADAPLLVINHHENDSIRKKYLPLIKKSCLEGEGSCMEYAKIQDRILVSEDQPQIYGMQFRYNDERNLEPFPIVDPGQVDQRRKEIGLEPLKDYLKRKINYDWTVEREK